MYVSLGGSAKFSYFAPVIETRVSQCLVWFAQRFFNLCKQQQDTYL